jgi:pyridoxal phosphate enzyme (YggS family)
MLFLDLPERVREIRDRIDAAATRGGHGQQVSVVAVTKSHGPEAPAAAYAAGLRDVGENKVQEALAKMKEVEVPVRWHLIGHLQRNKVRTLAQFALLHSLDSSRLADAVDALGMALGRPVDALLQVNASGEGTKGGFALAEVEREGERLRALRGIRVLGTMTMAPAEADERMLRSTFASAREAMAMLARAGHPVTELSMGMSNDYEIAVEEGATCVRLGTVLFGVRAT